MQHACHRLLDTAAIRERAVQSLAVWHDLCNLLFPGEQHMYGRATQLTTIHVIDTFLIITIIIIKVSSICAIREKLFADEQHMGYPLKEFSSISI